MFVLCSCYVYFMFLLCSCYVCVLQIFFLCVMNNSYFRHLNTLFIQPMLWADSVTGFRVPVGFGWARMGAVTVDVTQRAGCPPLISPWGDMTACRSCCTSWTHKDLIIIHTLSTHTSPTDNTSWMLQYVEAAGSKGTHESWSDRDPDKDHNRTDRPQTLQVNCRNPKASCCTSQQSFNRAEK